MTAIVAKTLASTRLTKSQETGGRYNESKIEGITFKFLNWGEEIATEQE